MTMEKELAVFKGMKQMFFSREYWTQGALARNVEEHSVDPTLNEARCFCILGAALHMKYQLQVPSGSIRVERCLHDAAQELFKTVPEYINDGWSVKKNGSEPTEKECFIRVHAIIDYAIVLAALATPGGDVI